MRITSYLFAAIIILQAIGPHGMAQQVRIDVTRDTWVSSFAGERDGNLGGAERLKFKGIQEFSVMDIDPAPLRGRVIESATLHVHARSADWLRRTTVSTLASEWTEGAGTRYDVLPGAASFNWAKQHERPWAWPGSDILAVSLGGGHTRWGYADASAPGRFGFQTIAVDPNVIAPRVAGISDGFVVFDDVGSEYTREGDRIKYHLFPNRFASSREAGADMAPYFMVQLGEEDNDPPGEVEALRAHIPEVLDARNDPRGDVRLTWRTPEDTGDAGVIGFHVRMMRGEGPFDWDRALPVPRYLIPSAGKPHETVTMWLRDLDVDAGERVRFAVRAVDGAGNVGPPAMTEVTWPQAVTVELPDTDIAPFEPEGEMPTIGGAKVFAIDALDKIDAVSGRMIPARDAAYRRGNHLWSAGERRVRLFGARNEFVAFQFVIQGQINGLRASLVFDNQSHDSQQAIRAKLYRARHVSAGGMTLPDPLLPLSDTDSIDVPARDEAISDQRFATIFAEVYVPHEARSGAHGGKLLLEHGDERLVIDVNLRVWQFTLPDYLSFVPQMNAYSLPDLPVERDYYRMAHEHRVCLNRLAYNWAGHVRKGFVPETAGGEVDWFKYDVRFGPLFDGSLFADLPRGTVPVEAFYLPINENWPVAIETGFRGGYWAEAALNNTYRENFVRSCRAFAEHFAARGWHDTFFEFYLNGKVFFKERGWDVCSSPWVFDEPVNTQDFRALRWYGRAFHEGVFPVTSTTPLKFVFRADISRPQWQRDMLDGVLDVNVVSGAMQKYERMVIGRKLAHGEIVYNYGSTNPVERSNVQPAAWCVDAWTRGGDGVLPWQTIGNSGSWKQGDALSLFYPGGEVSQRGPIASVRLKGYRRGQQDVEYLTLLVQATGHSRWTVADAARRVLRLEGTFEKKSENDAGLVSYETVDPAALWRLRASMGTILDELKPAAKRRLTELRTPVRDMDAVPEMEVVR